MLPLIIDIPMNVRLLLPVVTSSWLVLSMTCVGLFVACMSPLFTIELLQPQVIIPSLFGLHPMPP